MIIGQQVGGFDYYEFGLPSLAYTAWEALVVSLIAIALVVGTKRERLALMTAVAAALALPVLLVATTMRHTGFSLQGRYVLPFSVAAVLLAGEILVRQNERLRWLGAQRLFVPFAACAACLQLVAWWSNSHRFAVGLGGPRWFLDKAEWVPLAGWWPWFALAVTGATLLAISEPLGRVVTIGRRRRDSAKSHRADAAARVSR
jgi:hypothetical protein